MTQETIQESAPKRPAYADWLASLKQKVESSAQEEEEELRWKQRYGKA